MKIKNCIDLLGSIGHSLLTKDHLEAIFNGLNKEYDTFIILIISRNDVILLNK